VSASLNYTIMLPNTHLKYINSSEKLHLQLSLTVVRFMNENMPSDTTL